MPGRSLTPPDVKRQKRAAMIAARARAQARDGPPPVTADELECARAIMREVQAGSNVDEACARRELRSYDFWDWLARAPVLAPELELALHNRGLAYGEQPVGIADRSLRDPVAFYTDKNGVRRVDPGYVQLQKLRIDARQWDAERLRSATYAPKGVDNKPVAVHVTVQRFVVGTDERDALNATPQRERERDSV